MFHPRLRGGRLLLEDRNGAARDGARILARPAARRPGIWPGHGLGCRVRFQAKGAGDRAPAGCEAGSSCTSTTVVAAASPNCAQSSSRPAASPIRSKTGRPPRPRPGCSPRSEKTDRVVGYRGHAAGAVCRRKPRRLATDRNSPRPGGKPQTPQNYGAAHFIRVKKKGTGAMSGGKPGRSGGENSSLRPQSNATTSRSWWV